MSSSDLEVRKPVGAPDSGGTPAGLKWWSALGLVVMTGAGMSFGYWLESLLEPKFNVWLSGAGLPAITFLVAAAHPRTGRQTAILGAIGLIMVLLSILLLAAAVQIAQSSWVEAVGPVLQWIVLGACICLIVLVAVYGIRGACRHYGVPLYRSER